MRESRPRSLAAIRARTTNGTHGTRRPTIMKNRVILVGLAAGVLITAWVVATRDRSTDAHARGVPHDREVVRGVGRRGPSPSGDGTPTTKRPSGESEERTTPVAPQEADGGEAREGIGVELRERPAGSRAKIRRAPGGGAPPVSTRTDSAPPQPRPLAPATSIDSSRQGQLEALRRLESATTADHVRAGLAWLALHQASDGHFSEVVCRARCQELEHAPICAAPGVVRRRIISTTGLALIAFCRFRGHDNEGLFEPSLAGAARWLQRNQKADGSFALVGGDDVPYRTAIALTALGVVAASSGEAELRAAVERGMTSLAADPNNGARRDLDTLACIAQAIEAARTAGAEVPAAFVLQMRDQLAKYWVEDERFQRHSARMPAKAVPSAIGMFAAWTLHDELSGGVVQAWRDWLESPSAQPDRTPYATFYSLRMTRLLNLDIPQPWLGSLAEIAAQQRRKGSRAGSFPTLSSGWWMEPTKPETTFQTAAALVALVQDMTVAEEETR